MSIIQVNAMQRKTRRIMRLDTQINFRTSSEIKEELERLAKSKGMKPSQLLNEIVANFLGRQESQNTESVDLETAYKTLSQRLEHLEQQQQEIAKKLAA
jgi:predicted DNA-binding protein